MQSLRLADFIEHDLEKILSTWDDFARKQMPAAETVEFDVLRDHAGELLQAVIADLRTPQTSSEQERKSLGQGPTHKAGGKTAAERHGQARALLGFEVEQLVAEFRALRASVLRLWSTACEPQNTHAGDMMRFNEAIDQALAESISLFSKKATQERNLLLGTLGHDMRSPLHVIQASATALEKHPSAQGVAVIGTRIRKCSFQLKSLLDDLVDFNRIKLGRGLPVAPVHTELDILFEETLEQIRSAHSGREVVLQVTGDVRGTWDPQRVQQVLSNLVINAFKYGAKNTDVGVFLLGMDALIEFRVVNQGPKIEPGMIGHIFDPLIRGGQRLDGTERIASLGLGLHIARQIVEAHGGTISVSSNDSETAFTVRLPRADGECDDRSGGIVVASCPPGEDWALGSLAVGDALDEQDESRRKQRIG